METYSLVRNRDFRTLVSGEPEKVLKVLEKEIDAQKNNFVSALNGKVVSFTYTEGSRVGKRLVKVKQAWTEGQKYRLTGLDLEVDDEKTAHRRYNSEHISGEIKIIN